MSPSDPPSLPPQVLSQFNSVGETYVQHDQGSQWILMLFVLQALSLNIHRICHSQNESSHTISVAQFVFPIKVFTCSIMSFVMYLHIPPGVW